MTGIFKSLWQRNMDTMKHLGSVPIILLLWVGVLLAGMAAGELTAFQNLVPSAEVGQMVTLTVSLTYNGQNSTEAVVTPVLPSGVVANDGGQNIELYPGVTQQISYPLTAEQSGNYWIASDISYAEGGAWRNLKLEAPFTATSSASQSQGIQQIGAGGTQMPVVGIGQGYGTNPPTNPDSAQPGNVQQYPQGNNGTEDGRNGYPGGMPQQGMPQQPDGYGSMPSSGVSDPSGIDDAPASAQGPGEEHP